MTSLPPAHEWAPAQGSVPPRLRRDVRISPAILRDGRWVHVVSDERVDGLYLVGEREAFIASRLDGRSTFAEITDGYRERFGRTLGGASWSQLFGLLAERALLELPVDDDARLDRLRRAAAERRDAGQGLLVRRWPLVDPDAALRSLVRRAPWTASRGALVLASAAAVLLIVLVPARWSDLWPRYQEAWRDEPGTAWAAVLVVLVSLVAHEVGHGLACVRLGGSCHEMGVSWRAPLLTVYTRVDDVTHLERARDRVTVTLAGVVVQSAVLAPWVLALLVSGVGSAGHGLVVVVVVTGWAATTVNLLPVLHLDGEKAVAHAVRVWDLAGEARHLSGVLVGRASTVATTTQRAVVGVVVVLIGTASIVLVVVLLRWWWGAVGSDTPVWVLGLQGGAAVLFVLVRSARRRRRAGVAS